MKITKKQLQNIIKEEYLKGVEEHQFKSVTADYVDNVERLLKRHVFLNKSTTPAQRAQSLNVASQVLKEFEKQVDELLQDTLNKFTQNT